MERSLIVYNAAKCGKGHSDFRADAEIVPQKQIRAKLIYVQLCLCKNIRKGMIRFAGILFRILKTGMKALKFAELFGNCVYMERLRL